MESLVICLFAFSKADSKILIETTDFPAVGGGQSKTPGVFHPAEFGDKRRAVMPQMPALGSGMTPQR